jgi:tetratricopeptide (TPR) repeat protein
MFNNYQSIKMLRGYLVAIALLLAQWCAAQSGDAVRTAAPPEEISTREVETDKYIANKFVSAEGYWENITKATPKNEEAWLNYYKAVRFGSYTEHSREISKDEKKKLNGIIAKMEVEVANSFSYHYACYLNGNKTDDALSHLQTAYFMHPENQELWDDMLFNAAVANDEVEVARFARMLQNAGVYDAAEMEYNRNVLNSLEQNAMLITYGNVDTYPLILLQKNEGFRTDVKIVCLDWINNSRYKTLVETSLKLMPGKIRPAETNLALDEIFNSKSNYAIYLALTIPPDVLAKCASELYCTGLAMKFSKQAIANITSLEYNWSKLFNKLYVDSGKELNRNYLVPLCLLHGYYLSIGNVPAAESVKNQIVRISNQFGLQNKTKNYISD